MAINTSDWGNDPSEWRRRAREAFLGQQSGLTPAGGLDPYYTGQTGFTMPEEVGYGEPDDMERVFEPGQEPAVTGRHALPARQLYEPTQGLPGAVSEMLGFMEEQRWSSGWSRWRSPGEPTPSERRQAAGRPLGPGEGLPTTPGFQALYRYGSGLGLTRRQTYEMVQEGAATGQVGGRSVGAAKEYMARTLLGPGYEPYKAATLRGSPREREGGYVSPTTWQRLPQHQRARMAGQVPISELKEGPYGQPIVPPELFRRGQEAHAFPWSAITGASFWGHTPEGKVVTTWPPEKAEKRIQMAGAHETMRVSGLRPSPGLGRHGPASLGAETLQQNIRAALVIGGDVGGPGTGLLDLPGATASQRVTREVRPEEGWSPTWLATPGATWGPGSQMQLAQGMTGEPTGKYRYTVADVVPLEGGGYRYTIDREARLAQARLAMKAMGTKVQMMPADLSRVTTEAGEPLNLQAMMAMKDVQGAIALRYSSLGRGELARDISKLPAEMKREYGLEGRSIKATREWMEGKSYAEMGMLPMQAYLAQRAGGAQQQGDIQTVIYPQVMTQENLARFDPGMVRGTEQLPGGMVRANIAYQAIVGDIGAMFSQEHAFRRPFLSTEEMSYLQKANPAEYERLYKAGTPTREAYRDVMRAGLASTGQYAAPPGAIGISTATAGGLYGAASEAAREAMGVGPGERVSRFAIAQQMLGMLAGSPIGEKPLRFEMPGQAPVFAPSAQTLMRFRARGDVEGQEKAAAINAITELMGRMGEGIDVEKAFGKARSEIMGLAESPEVIRRTMGTELDKMHSLGDVLHMSLALRPGEAYIPQLPGAGVGGVAQAMRFPSQQVASYAKEAGVQLLGHEEAARREMSPGVAQFSPEMIMSMAGDADGDKFLAWIRGDARIDGQGNLVGSDGTVMGNFDVISKGALRRGAEGAANIWNEMASMTGNALQSPEAARQMVSKVVQNASVSTPEELRAHFEKGSHLRGQIGQIFNFYRGPAGMIPERAQNAFQTLWRVAYGRAQRPAEQLPGMQVLHSVAKGSLISSKTGGIMGSAYDPQSQELRRYVTGGRGYMGAIQEAAYGLRDLRGEEGQPLLRGQEFGQLFAGTGEAVPGISAAYEKVQQALGGKGDVRWASSRLYGTIMEQGIETLAESPMGQMLFPRLTRSAMAKGADLGLTQEQLAQRLQVSPEFFQEQLKRADLQRARITSLTKSRVGLTERAEAMREAGMADWLPGRQEQAITQPAPLGPGIEEDPRRAAQVTERVSPERVEQTMRGLPQAPGRISRGEDIGQIEAYLRGMLKPEHQGRLTGVQYDPELKPYGRTDIEMDPEQYSWGKMVPASAGIKFGPRFLGLSAERQRTIALHELGHVVTPGFDKGLPGALQERMEEELPGLAKRVKGHAGRELFADIFQSMMGGTPVRAAPGVISEQEEQALQGIMKQFAPEVFGQTKRYLTRSAQQAVAERAEAGKIQYGWSRPEESLATQAAAPPAPSGDLFGARKRAFSRVVRGIMGGMSPEEFSRRSQEIRATGKTSPLRQAFQQLMAGVPQDLRGEAAQVWQAAVEEAGIPTKTDPATGAMFHDYKQVVGTSIYQRRGVATATQGGEPPAGKEQLVQEIRQKWGATGEMAPTQWASIGMSLEEIPPEAFDEEGPPPDINEQLGRGRKTLADIKAAARQRAQQATMAGTPGPIRDMVGRITGGGESAESGYVRWTKSGRIFGQLGEQTINVTEEHLQRIQNVNRSLQLWDKAIGPTIDAGEDMTKAQVKLTDMMEKMVKGAQLERLETQGRQAGEFSMARQAADYIAGMRGEGMPLGRLGMARDYIQQQQFMEQFRQAAGVGGAGGPGGEGGGWGAGRLGGLIGPRGFQPGGLMRGIASGWELMRLRRLWGLTGGAAFGAMGPAAEEQQMAMQAAMVGQPFGEGGMAPMMTQLMTTRAAQQQFQLQMGRSTAQAWGWLPQAFANTGVGTAAGIAAPGIGLGLGAGWMGGLMGLAAGPIGAGVAGAATLYGTYQYLKNRPEEDVAIQAARAQFERGTLPEGYWEGPTFGPGVTGAIPEQVAEGYSQEQIQYGERILSGELPGLPVPGRVKAIQEAYEVAPQWLEQTQAEQMAYQWMQLTPGATNIRQIYQDPRFEAMAARGLNPQSIAQMTEQFGMRPEQWLEAYNYMALVPEAQFPQMQTNVQRWQGLRAWGAEPEDIFRRGVAGQLPEGGAQAFGTLGGMLGGLVGGDIGATISQAGQRITGALTPARPLGEMTADPALQAQWQSLQTIAQQQRMMGMAPIEEPGTEADIGRIYTQQSQMAQREISFAQGMMNRGLPMERAGPFAQQFLGEWGMQGQMAFEGFLGGNQGVLNMIGQANTMGPFADLGVGGLQMNVGQMRDAIVDGLEQIIPAQYFDDVMEGMSALKPLVEESGLAMGTTQMYPGFAKGYQLPGGVDQGMFEEFAGIAETGGRRELQRLQTGITNAYQDFQMRQQEENLALQGVSQFGGRFTSRYSGETLETRGSFAIQKELRNLGQIWEDFSNDFQQQQRQLGYAQFMENWGVRAERMPVGFQWQREDLAFRGQQASVQFGWQMEDIQENLRFATGRDRRRLMRQQERAAVQFGMGMGQLETQGERIDVRERWAREDLERERRQFEERFALQDQYQDQYRRFTEERRRLEDELQAIREFNARFSLDAANEQLQRQKEMQAQLRAINEVYTAINQQLQNAGAQQQQLVTTMNWFMGQFGTGGGLRSSWDGFIGHVTSSLATAAASLAIPQSTWEY